MCWEIISFRKILKIDKLCKWKVTVSKFLLVLHHGNIISKLKFNCLIILKKKKKKWMMVIRNKSIGSFVAFNQKTGIRLWRFTICPEESSTLWTSVSVAVLGRILNMCGQIMRSQFSDFYIVITCLFLCFQLVLVTFLGFLRTRIAISSYFKILIQLVVEPKYRNQYKVFAWP